MNLFGTSMEAGKVTVLPESVELTRSRSTDIEEKNLFGTSLESGKVTVERADPKQVWYVHLWYHVK
jgi:hypothetical protein